MQSNENYLCTKSKSYMPYLFLPEQQTVGGGDVRVLQPVIPHLSHVLLAHGVQQQGRGKGEEGHHAPREGHHTHIGPVRGMVVEDGLTTEANDRGHEAETLDNPDLGGEKTLVDGLFRGLLVVRLIKLVRLVSGERSRVVTENEEVGREFGAS